MKILHVTLGNPKDHQGGLNRYCFELMQYQQEQGHEVELLYPSSTGDYIKHIAIKKDSDGFWRVIGALPVPITYGIDNPKRYMKKADEKVYLEWLRKIRPDITHVHSIQGIHYEFFGVLKELDIPSIYTTHDFYPICLRGLLIDASGQRCTGPEEEKCARCNEHAGLSPHVQAVRQAYVYKTLKKHVKRIRLFTGYAKKRGDEVYSVSNEDPFQEHVSIKTCSGFNKLISYNRKIMETITAFHCNSPKTQQIYKEFYPNIDSYCIPVIHNGLKRTKHHQVGTIKFSYLGGTGIPKGFKLLQNAILLLEKNAVENWEVFFYGGEFNEKCDDPRIHFQGYFTAERENEVWEKTDVLIVPSIWYETYGFAVVEGLCHGIPVIASDTVGSGYLLNEIDEKLVFPSGDFKQLFLTMKYVLQNNHYESITNKIANIKLPISLSEHWTQIQHIYKEIIQEKKEYGENYKQNCF